MSLDEAQRKKVSEWVAAGMKLSEIQNRLSAELDVRMTYMEVRLLVDDLKLTPKDAEPVKPVTPVQPEPMAPTSPATPVTPPGEIPKSGGVTVSVDQLARPGAVVSGKVIFSDGVKAEWYFDQTGRLGLSASQPGYRPSQPDLQSFQTALDAELSKMGF